AVTASEALQIGLANRLVPRGTARAAAEDLALELAAFPQACLRGDRRSALEQHALELPAALQNELRHGVHALSLEGIGGARRFAAGAGRHGAPAPRDAAAAPSQSDRVFCAQKE